MSVKCMLVFNLMLLSFRRGGGTRSFYYIKLWFCSWLLLCDQCLCVGLYVLSLSCSSTTLSILLLIRLIHENTITIGHVSNIKCKNLRILTFSMGGHGVWWLNFPALVWFSLVKKFFCWIDFQLWEIFFVFLSLRSKNPNIVVLNSF